MQTPRNSNMVFLRVFLVVFSSFCMKPLKCQKFDFNVGIILDSDTIVGKMKHTCMLMALDDLNSDPNQLIKIVPHFRNPGSDVLEAASLAIDLLKNVQVHAILGPQLSTQAAFVINIGNKTEVPIISPATNPFLSPRESPYFVRVAMSSSFQTQAIASMVKAFGWSEIVIISEKSDYGTGFVPYFSDAMRNISTLITYRSVISPSWSDEEIHQELIKLKNKSTRVFVVHMLPPLASRLFVKAKEEEMMNKEYAWIITDLLTGSLGSWNSSVVASMQGVLGLKPYFPKTNELQAFIKKWRNRFYQENPKMDTYELSTPGLWAYDTIKALAMALETVITVPVQFKFKKSVKSENMMDFDAIGTSEIGPLLIKSLKNISLKGISGNFSIVDGQLQLSSFQIVNVIGNGEREIGFWSQRYGISRQPIPSNRTDYQTNKEDLRAIIWPGESNVIPKGWEFPATSDKKLKIGVPFKTGFKEFVDVGTDFRIGPINPTGFCIDIFHEVMKSLPYAVPYDFFAIEGLDYGELVNQVVLQKYDAIVGDVTILAKRSEYVDFTLPFTESGVAIVAPTKADETKNPWIFLKPLRWDLWLTITCFFIFTGFVVWVLEHRVNQDFRGPPRKQVGVIFWFSFSTMVFAQREKIISNLTRFVVIVWILVVLVLTSSYQASLTSMLTVQKLQPTITSIADLVKNQEYVGYQDGSFVTELLKSRNLDSSKFRNYSTPEQYHEALTKGSKNGGVAAIIDELPYIRLFVTKFSKKYAIVGSIYRTAGFGFVFPKGSPLVEDVSRAVLNVTEGDIMMNITRKWFGEEADSPMGQISEVVSSSLTLESFWGLFLVAGVSSSLALIIYMVIFFYDNRDILASDDPILQKLSKIAKIFDEVKENASGELKRSIEIVDVGVVAIENNPQSPVSIFNGAEDVFSPDEGFSTPYEGSPTRDIILTTERNEQR